MLFIFDSYFIILIICLHMPARISSSLDEHGVCVAFIVPLAMKHAFLRMNSSREVYMQPDCRVSRARRVSRATTTVRFRHREGKVSCPERTVAS